MNIKRKFIEVIICVTIFLASGFYFGYRACESKMSEENQYYLESNEELVEVNIGWRYAAEQYGGICKWLLEGKPIYGTIVMDANSILSGCLIVSGGEYAIEMTGTNGLIKDNHFVMADMDWVDSLKAVDPNEFEEISP